MMEINSELPLSAEQGHVSAVDDDDVVARVVHRVEDGLVLAFQHARDLLRRVEGVLPLGIVKVPETIF
jgi:hypothetical protein